MSKITATFADPYPEMTKWRERGAVLEGRYRDLLFVATVGYAMFGELLLLNTCVGSTVIIEAALYVSAHGRSREVSAASLY